MILKSGVWIVSGIIFLINLFIIYKKKKSIIAEYILWHFVVTIIISSIFFAYACSDQVNSRKGLFGKNTDMVII